MKIVGTNRPIHDARGKVSGATRYAGDLTLPGLLHAALVTSTVPNGLVLEVDSSEALRVPGVVAVLDCFNLDSRLFNRYRSVKGQKVIDQERVFNRRVRFVGDRVACVFADGPETARLAAGLVRVAYEEYPASLTIEDTLAGRIDQIHPDGAIYGQVELEAGRPEAAAEADLIVATESRPARINHLALETHVCLAAYDPGLDELTIWSPSQSVHGIRTVVADLLGLNYHRVRVIKTTMGGSFGGKQEWILEPVAAAASYRLKRPVKLVFSRDQVFTSTINRAPMRLALEAAYKNDGSLLSLKVGHTLDAGAYLGNSIDYCHAMSKKFFRCYKYPHLKYQGRAVITNTPVSGAFRGWSSPESAIALEHNLNQAARRLSMDPLELRLKNAARPGDVDLCLNVDLGDFRLADCLIRGRKLFDWPGRQARIRNTNRPGGRYRRGLGVACGGHLNGYYPKINDFAEVGLRMAEDGTVMANVTLHDHGCGTVTAFKMIIAEALGISYDQVRVGEGDTAVTPFDYGCYSSRTTYVIGRAAEDCARKMLERLREATARASGRELNNLKAEGGLITDRSDPGWALTLGEVSQMSLSVLKEEISVTVQHVNQSNPGVGGAHLAEVEVDTASGMVRIVDYLAVHDIGQAINRALCVAQIQGAVLMGAGAALYEEVKIDPRGRATRSLKDYHLINSFEAPEIRVELIEKGGTPGPFGAKSIGEVCHVPVAPAILGAVNDALGADCAELPLNPDRIVRLLKERGYQYETEF